MTPLARMATSLTLGFTLAAGVLAASCAIDPEPPNPHCDGGCDDPPDPKDGGDGGGGSTP